MMPLFVISILVKFLVSESPTLGEKRQSRLLVL